MGASASKASRAVGASARKYPTRAPQPTVATTTQTSSHKPVPEAPAATSQSVPPRSRPGPIVHPTPQARTTRDEAVNLDASDPDFAQSLRTLGPVQPNPTLSPTSAFPSSAEAAGNQTRPAGPNQRANPALAILEARSRLQEEAEREFLEAGRGRGGREFLDVYTIRQVLVQRDEYGKSAQEIEKGLGLKDGVVKRLGRKGVVGVVDEVGPARKGVEVV